jgi:hypothetical protein
LAIWRVVERERDVESSRPLLGVAPRPRMDEDEGGGTSGRGAPALAGEVFAGARDFERELPRTRSLTSLLMPRSVAASEKRLLPRRPRSSMDGADVLYGLVSATRLGA